MAQIYAFFRLKFKIKMSTLSKISVLVLINIKSVDILKTSKGRREEEVGEGVTEVG